METVKFYLYFWWEEWVEVDLSFLTSDRTLGPQQ